MLRFAAAVLLILASCATLEAPPAAPGMTVAAKSVALDADHPGRSILGRLRYLGGLALSSTDPRFGGLSSLKWRDGHLHSVTDAGDWVSLDPAERDGRLEGVRVTAFGDLLDSDGRVLEGTDKGDAEALAPDGEGWLVGFEHEHKLLRYSRLGASALSRIDSQKLFGPLEANQGVETLAARGGRLFLCAERLPANGAPNCYIRSARGDAPVSVPPMPSALDPKTAFPVDADWTADGTLYILMRSWSGGNDNRAAIVTRSPAGNFRILATLVPPIATDNYEGLAVREERGRAFLYIVSDDNFGQYDDPARPETWQRTLLMKFELVG